MLAIIDAIEAKELDARIGVVLANKKDCYALERARNYNLKAVFVDQKGKSREEYDKELAKELDKEGVELILLIGYMKYLSPWFVNKYKNRIMNIHPSLLPAFGGGMDKDVHKEILDHGCKVTGCTLHFVDESLDGGPIILQKPVMIEEGESVGSLKQKVQKAEQEVILKAIDLFKENRLKVEGGIVHIK